MEMKLAAIYNVWHDWDLLDHSIRNIKSLVDGIIIVGSEYSNYGEHSPITASYPVSICEPKKQSPMANETMKRNHGLEVARKAGYTHFISMDADEFYEPISFFHHKKLFKNPDLKGLVCRCQTYFRSPALTIGLDTTLVPFIHELTPTIRHDFNRKYPFAWIDGKIRIDPTRSLNINSGVEMCDIIMQHYSWVRKDIEIKIRNSSARENIERSTVRQDFVSAQEGYFVKYYGKTLATVPNLFNIPDYGELLDQNIQSVPAADPAN